ncbi:hypothetical protein QUF75_20250 [Desulfococcaceae bacterium HSG7]|nr:hypothetical protein [Desulfococcaceae bacterium HSG7]
MQSSFSDEFAKNPACQMRFRTYAIISEKVASVLLYHAQFMMFGASSLSISVAAKTIKEKMPDKTGAVLAIALSDPGLFSST